MHCASCAGTIERVLLKTAGVHVATVNFASETTLVEFDENIISETGLAQAVESVGYKLDVGLRASPAHSHADASMDKMDMRVKSFNYLTETVFFRKSENLTETFFFSSTFCELFFCL